MPGATPQDFRKIVDDRKATSKVVFNQFSQRRFQEILDKKLTTCFIGALAQFEAFFGELWGHGKHDAQCTSEQLANREVWQLCRKAVLDNGNNQLKALKSEISQYEVHWNRVNTILPVVQENKKE